MKLLMLFSLLFVFGCGKIDRLVTHYTGNMTYKCSKHGVEYVQSDSGMAVSYNQDGTLVKCKD